MIVLQTPDLYLREADENDIDAYANLYDDDKFRRYLTPSGAYTAKANLIRNFRANKKSVLQQPEIFLSIVEKENDQAIGLVQLADMDKKTAHISYGLDPGFWNRGLQTQAVKAATGFAYQAGEINAIKTSVLKENIGSRRVLEKCGYTKTGESWRHWHDYEEPDAKVFTYESKRPGFTV